MREWRGQEHYKKVFAAVADRLVGETDARILFLPMQWPDDLQAARAVSERMRERCAVLEGNYDTDELLSIVGNLDLLVGVRLHALIFAAVMGVPFVGVSYDPKIDRFLATLDECNAGELDNVSVEALLERIRQTHADETAKAGRCRRVSQLREQALQNARFALNWRRKKRDN